MAKVDTIIKAGFKIKKRVTLPLFKIAPNVEMYLRSEGPIFIGKEINDSTPGAKKKEPAHLMNVLNLETGELGQIICGSVLQGIFSEEYPDDSYVGKSFAVEMHKIVGKDYNGYSVTEIEASEAPGGQGTDYAGGSGQEQEGGAGKGERHTVNKKK